MVIVGDGKTEALVFQVANDIVCLVQKVGEFFLKIRMAGYFVRVGFLAICDDPGPLESFEHFGVKPFGSCQNRNGFALLILVGIALGIVLLLLRALLR